MSKDFMAKSFHVMAKPVGALCNLSCSYCFYRNKGKLYPKTEQLMSDQVLESYIKQLIEMEPSNQVTIAWQGGEPTIAGVDFYRKANRFALKYLVKGKRILWTIQTNGLLLNDEWCDFFHQNGFLVGLSLDGPKEIHDINRVDNLGNGSFDRVMHSIELIRKHDVNFNILCSVNSKNAIDGAQVYRFLRDTAGARYIQFIPIVERLPIDEQITADKHIVSSRSVEPNQWGQFLIDVFDQWVQTDVGEVFVLMFDWILSSWIGQESTSCIFQHNCGRALVLERNGDVYSCDHFVDPDHYLGNILKIPLKQICSLEKQLKFAQNKSQLPKYCVECTFNFACNGECPKNRFIATTAQEPGLNYLCAGYRKFFCHVAKPMQTMANLILNNRPASEIMYQ